MVSKRRPALVKRILRRQLERQLPAGYDIDTHFTPRYNPWDQRLCVVPDGDLFKAISAGTVSVVTDQIDTFTEKGLRLASGDELEADIVVTATGIELLFIGGIELSVDGEAVDVSTKLTYKGMMLEGVPNLAIAIGYTNASWTLKCDLTCDYVSRLLNHMRMIGATPVHAGQPRRHRQRSAAARPHLGLRAALRRSLPEAGLRLPLAGSPELPARLPGAQVEGHRRRGHGAVQSHP